MEKSNNLDEIGDSDEDKTLIDDPIISPVILTGFVTTFSTLILELHSLPNLWHMLHSFTQGLAIIQMCVASLFSSYHSFWSQTEPRQIVYFMSAFLRLIPANASNKIHDFAVFSIFLYSIFIWIILFFLFFTFKSTHFFLKLPNKVFVIVVIFVFRFLEYPTVSLLGYEICRVNRDQGITLAVFAAISFVLCILGTTLLEIVHYHYPSIQSSCLSCWVTPNLLFIHMFSNIIVFGCEIIDIFHNKYAEVAFIAVNMTYNIVVFIDEYYNVPCTTFTSNIIISSSLILSIFLDILMIIAIQATCISSYIIPVSISSLIIIVAANTYIFHFRIFNLQNLFREARLSRNTAKINKLGARSVISGICLIFREDVTDWFLFDWMISKYANSYQHCAIYAKMVILYPEQRSRLINIILRLRHLQGQLARRKALTYLVEYLLIQQDPPPNWTVIRTMCNNYVDDYFTTLQLFWTEILLGRADRLISLSSAVNNKYYQVERMFAEIGVNNLSSSNYQRYRSVCWQRDPDKYVERNLLRTVYQETYKVFNMEEIPVVPSNSQTENNRCLSVEEIQQKSKQSMTIADTFVFSTPFIYAGMLLVCIIVYIALMDRRVTEVWQLYEKIVNPFFTFAALYFGFPISALLESNILNKTKLSNYFHNGDLFQSKLMNPVSDLRYLRAKTDDYIEPMIAAFDSFPFQKEVSPFYDETFEINLIFKNDTYDEKLSFVATLMLFMTQFEYILERPVDEMIQMFDSHDSVLTTASFVQILSFTAEFLENYTVVLSDKITDTLNEQTHRFFHFAYTMFFLSIVIIVIAFYYMYRSYSNLFAILFALPKNEVSNLMSKLGKKKSETSLSTSRIDCDLRYNLNQLTIQAPPHTFMTFKHIAFRSILIPILLCLIFLALLYPSILMLRSNIRESMTNLKNARSITVTPLYYFLIGSDIAQEVLIYTKNFSTPERIDELIDRIYDHTNVTYTERIPSITYLEEFPFLISIDLFLNSNDCSEDLPYSRCLSQVGVTLSMLAFSFDYVKCVLKNETIDETTKLNLFGFICTTISLIVPNMAEKTFTAVYEHTYSFRFIGILTVYYYTFAIIFLYQVMLFVVRKFSNHNDFSNAILSSIPINVITECYKAFKEVMKQKEKNNDVEEVLFESPETFQAITDIILLLDSDNNIIESTPSAQVRLMFDPIGMTMQQLLNQICPCQFAIQLPPYICTNFHLDVKVPSVACLEAITLILKVTLLPLKRFDYNHKTVSYACVMTDETQHEMLVMQMNNEANHVRMLMTQLIPWQVANILLGSQNYNTVILSKVLTASFFLCGFDTLTITDIREIQRLIREQLSRHVNLTYSGRSIQMFRVYGGVFGTNDISYEDVMDIVTFAMDLMTSLHSSFPNVEFRNGIHISGPFFADAISEIPPVFDLFGNSMAISSLIATSCPPDQVNVSRPVYIEIIDHGFKIELAAEITSFDNEIISIYRVVDI